MQKWEHMVATVVATCYVVIMSIGVCWEIGIWFYP